MSLVSATMLAISGWEVVRIAAPRFSWCAPLVVRFLAAIVAGTVTLWVSGYEVVEVLLLACVSTALAALWHRCLVPARTPQQVLAAALGVAASAVGLIVAAPWLPVRPSAPIIGWVERGGFDPLGLSPSQVLVATSAVAMAMSPANQLVRLVLEFADPGAANAPSGLKGGRIIGPLERLLILGLGLAGEPTAAALIATAKGLVRYPELQRANTDGGRDVHRATEYVLVGSLASWLIASALALLVLSA